MNIRQKILCIDTQTGFYKIRRYPLETYFGPVDLGLHMADHYDSLNIGVGILAGSIFPGSNRLIFTGNSPCWGGFYISSMGGAGLVFNNLGLNMLSLLKRAPTPSILYLNRNKAPPASFAGDMPCSGEFVQGPPNRGAAEVIPSLQLFLGRDPLTRR